MKVTDVIDQCKNLTIVHKRRITPDYAEVVLPSKDILYWADVFSRIFGEPVSPAGIKPSEEDIALTKNFGGIGLHETLYRKDFAGGTLLAMFWPWQDGEHTTLKIVSLTNK